MKLCGRSAAPQASQECQVGHGAGQTHGCAQLLERRSQLPAAAQRAGSCSGALKGKML